MNRNTWLFIIVLIIILAGTGGFYALKNKAVAPTEPVPQASNVTDEDEIRSIVQQFGAKLRMVPLTGSSDVVSKAMDENYASFVSPDVLSTWKSRPLEAPGRLTSSPWPERIDVLEVEKDIDGSYVVQGKIVEVLGSGSEDSTQDASSTPLALRFRKIDGKWIITGSELQRPI